MKHPKLTTSDNTFITSTTFSIFNQLAHQTIYFCNERLLAKIVYSVRLHSDSIIYGCLIKFRPLAAERNKNVNNVRCHHGQVILQ